MKFDTRSNQVAGSDQTRVLHIDDEPGFAELTGEYIERENASISITTETIVPDALDTLDANSFDCIVSDYDMPGCIGIVFPEEARQDYPDITFILYTGTGSEEIASEAISAGITDYLQKEVRSEQYTVLANCIENAVSAH